MKAIASRAHWLCCFIALASCERGIQPDQIQQAPPKDSVPHFDSTAIARFDSLLQAEHKGAERFSSNGSPDTIEISLAEYIITNPQFTGLLDSISEATKSCPEFNFGSIVFRSGSKGVWIAVTVEDQNTVRPGKTGYATLNGRTFAISGVDELPWFTATGRKRSFQYIDYGSDGPYDPPFWYFLVRGDSIYRGAGSSFPCE